MLCRLENQADRDEPNQAIVEECVAFLSRFKMGAAMPARYEAELRRADVLIEWGEIIGTLQELRETQAAFVRSHGNKTKPGCGEEPQPGVANLI